MFVVINKYDQNNPNIKNKAKRNENDTANIFIVI